MTFKKLATRKGRFTSNLRPAAVEIPTRKCVDAGAQGRFSFVEIRREKTKNEKRPPKKAHELSPLTALESPKKPINNFEQIDGVPAVTFDSKFKRSPYPTQ